MKLPSEVPIMTLPNATLFPQALLPLYIFEPKYRQMLLDSLNTNRMFSVAMQKPGRTRETPSPIAGLGLIRVSVGHNDGTSHLILQGIARVELEETVRYKPYRVQRIRPIESPPCNELVVDALLAKVRELLEERVKLGMPFPFPVMSKEKSSKAAETAGFSAKDVLEYLDKLSDPEEVADLVSCAVLSGPVERQTILETVDLEARLKHLVHFLMAEITRQRKDKNR
ncbi:MAG: Peptidase lon domain protein [Pedosphaera sp.]|jgi:Lon protease-like protein|nr:Peptidase lon domain protein [Pedosphaera sp.]